MMNLENLNNEVLTHKTPVIRVNANGRVVFTEEAAKLLHLEDGSFVNFKVDGKRIYVGKVSVPGMRVTGKTPRKVFHSKYFAQKLANALAEQARTADKSLGFDYNGYGSYRIEEENKINVFPGDDYYSIFFRKYLK